MITEDYVSFEVAKLLKEKGFDTPVNTEYHCRKTLPATKVLGFHRHLRDFNGEEYRNLRSEWFSAPTLQMAMKWLREVYNLFISIYSYPYSYTTHGWSFLIHPIKYTDELGWNWDDSLEVLINKKNSDDNVYSTYEECCEKAIKHCLENLI